MKNTAKNNYEQKALNEMETVGARLSVFLDKIGYTRKDIAQEANVVFSTVSNYLEKDELPGPKFLAHLVERYGINVAWLLSGKGPMTTGEVSEECREIVERKDRNIDAEILDLRLEIAKRDREFADYILKTAKEAETARKLRDKALVALAIVAKAHGLTSDQHMAVMNAVIDPDRTLEETDVNGSHQQAVGD